LLDTITSKLSWQPSVRSNDSFSTTVCCNYNVIINYYNLLIATIRSPCFWQCNLFFIII
jgi:hypothetical protein